MTMNPDGRCKRCKYYENGNVRIECYYCDPEFGEDRFEYRADLEEYEAGMKQGINCETSKGSESDA